jgi:hypothetical protein
VAAIIIREKYDVLEKFMNVDDCTVVSQSEKKLSLISGVYTDRFTTLSCGDVTLKYEEGLGKFSVFVRIADFAVQIAYLYPEYIAFIYLDYDEKWDPNRKPIMVNESEFKNVRFSSGILTSDKYYITLHDILKKVKEIEKKYIEVLWPGQKIAYTAWVAYAMEKLGMSEELKKHQTA